MTVDKKPKSVDTGLAFLCGKYPLAREKGRYVVLDGAVAKSREQQGLTGATEAEAETLKRLLDANGQSFEIAQHAILTNQARVPTVADVIQEHIDLLVRPSSGTTRTYQVMLDLHVRNVIGHIPVDKLDATRSVEGVT